MVQKLDPTTKASKQGERKMTFMTYINAQKNFELFKRNRIMLVDDEEFCLSSMKCILFKLGINTDYRVDFCITGQEAVEQVKFALEHGAHYDIIFTDISMPIMNGIEATVKIRELLQGQPTAILGVTGHVQESFKREGEAAGMD